MTCRAVATTESASTAAEVSGGLDAGVVVSGGSAESLDVVTGTGARGEAGAFRPPPPRLMEIPAANSKPSRWSSETCR